MEQVNDLNTEIDTLVRWAGGRSTHADQAKLSLGKRERTISANIIESARSRGINERIVRNVLAEAGLTAAEPVDPRIADAERRVEIAQQRLAEAQAILAAVRQ